MRTFLSMVACGVVALSGTLLAQPKLEIVGGNTHDWGTVSFKESPLKANITLKNVGTELLKLNDPKPSCGCTTAPLETKDLKPGESTVMHITLNTYNAGPVTKSVTITSNDPANGTAVMYLKANVEKALQAVPSYLSFNNLEVGKEQSVTIKIMNSSTKDVTLSDFSSTNGTTINFTKPVVVKAGGSVDLVAKAKADKVGYFNTLVSMKTSHPDFPVLEVQGYGNVMEPAQSKVMNAGNK